MTNTKHPAQGGASDDACAFGRTQHDDTTGPANDKAADLSEAERFLTLLDETADGFTFQTFADTPEGRAEDAALKKQGQPRRHAAYRHGTLEQWAGWLERKNRDGAGIYITVNETDFAGRSNTNIRRIRAIWQEDDNGDAPAPPLEPHIVVQSSPGKHHRYILTDGAPLDEFEPVQRRMVDDYGSDPDAKDRARVLRLPGFFHQKDPSNPHMVRIIHESGAQPYQWETVKAHIPPVDMTPRLEAPEPSGRDTSELERILSFIPNDDAHYADFLKVGMAVHHETSGDEAGFNIWRGYSAKSDKHDDTEMRAKWESFGKNDSVVTIATLISIAKQHGYTANRTEAEIVADAKALDEESDSETIAALVTEAAALPPVAKRRVHNAIKKATGLPLSTIREAECDGKDAPDELDHLALARTVINAEGAENIIGTQAHVWRYRYTGVWRPLEPRAEKQIVQVHLEDAKEVDEITRALVDSVAEVFRTDVYQPSHEWNIGPEDAVCTPSGEVQLQGHQWALTGHRRDYYRTVQVPVCFDPDAKTERFVQFLGEIFKDDPDAGDKAAAILEMIGYSLMTHNRFERFAILVGAGANGKSVLLSVLEMLLGRENVAGVQPCQFYRSFQRAHLHLKLANIVTEIREGEVIADAELKSIVSGEPTTVEHKNRDPFEMRPYATCWFGTNHMPHTRDFSDALFRRALVVPFNRKFIPGKDADPKIKEKLLAELPGILNLALDAYTEVLQRGCFTEPESCLEAKRQWRLEADQAAQFVDEVCTSGTGDTPSSELFAAYKLWAFQAGIHRTLTHKSFAERVERLGYEKRHTRGGRMFSGLHLKATADDYRSERDGV